MGSADVPLRPSQYRLSQWAVSAVQFKIPWNGVRTILDSCKSSQLYLPLPLTRRPDVGRCIVPERLLLFEYALVEQRAARHRYTRPGGFRYVRSFACLLTTLSLT